MNAPTARPLIAALCAAAGLTVAAPALAAPAALPDWSGVWNPRERNLFDPSSLKPAERKAKDTQSSLFEASYLRMYPPYRPDYEARYETTLKNTAAGVGSDPTAACLPPGFPRIMGTPYPLEFMVQPDRVTILFEAFGQTRRIWTDGRRHPDDLDPSYNGHSIGHWEGDILVVDTVGLRGDTVFDVSGAAHSDAIHVTERIRRTSADSIEDQMVVEDPKALTRPWPVTRTYERKPDWQMAEYVCEENQRNPVQADGSTGFLGPH
jgi:hypothetical protein